MIKLVLYAEYLFSFIVCLFYAFSIKKQNLWYGIINVCEECIYKFPIDHKQFDIDLPKLIYIFIGLWKFWSYVLFINDIRIFYWVWIPNNKECPLIISLLVKGNH